MFNAVLHAGALSRASNHPYVIGAADVTIAAVGMNWGSLHTALDDGASEFLLWGGVALITLRLIATLPAVIAAVKVMRPGNR